MSNAFAATCRVSRCDSTTWMMSPAVMYSFAFITMLSYSSLLRFVLSVVSLGLGLGAGTAGAGAVNRAHSASIFRTASS